MINAIDPQKDVDGLHPLNTGMTATKQQPYFYSCTAMGIVKLLKAHTTDLTGKHVVIIGESNIVGRPTALMLLNENCTISICHKDTQDIETICQQADILIAAAGVPHLVQSSWINPGVVIIDVGIHRDNQNKIIGDVDFNAIKNTAAAITPVPGGVGPMTVACLIENTLLAAKRAHHV